MPYTYGMQGNTGLPPRAVQRAVGVSPDFPVVGNGLGGLPVRVTGPTPPTPSQQAFVTAGTFSWVAPANVISISVVAVGGGGNGDISTGKGGGGLGYKNNIAVTPGTSYTVVVGNSQATSYFINTGIVYGGGASSPAGGLFGGDGGGNGGAGGSGGGGGGAGGYAGNGGAGGGVGAVGSAGSGGGGGGGGGQDNKTTLSGGGGGVGILGQGANGGGGGIGQPAAGGSGGAAGVEIAGGLYGGGGGQSSGSSNGGRGAVRIIWGLGRAFPSTNTGNL